MPEKNFQSKWAFREKENTSHKTCKYCAKPWPLFSPSGRSRFQMHAAQSAVSSKTFSHPPLERADLLTRELWRLNHRSTPVAQQIYTVCVYVEKPVRETVRVGFSISKIHSWKLLTIQLSGVASFSRWHQWHGSYYMVLYLPKWMFICCCCCWV